MRGLCKKCKENEVEAGYWGKNSKWCIKCLGTTKKYRVALKRDRQKKFVIKFNREVFA